MCDVEARWTVPQEAWFSFMVFHRLLLDLGLSLSHLENLRDNFSSP